MWFKTSISSGLQERREYAGKLMYIFLSSISPYIELDAVSQKDWRETTGKMCISVTQQYLHNE